VELLPIISVIQSAAKYLTYERFFGSQARL